MRQVNPILTIAYRDFLKLVRDPTRLVATFIFPFIFIGLIGSSFQSNLGSDLGFDFLTFTFSGVLAQTLYQSAASGLISLIEDRESDFSQEIFVSPISRYAIILGKILGETMVALPQGFAIIVFGLIVGVPLSAPRILAILPVAIIACLIGGSFGVIVLANLGSQRAANQVFPFILLPQLFLAGTFNPIQVLPLPLDVLSRLTPLRYVVDLLRGVYYTGSPEYSRVVLASPVFNLAVLTAMFAVFLGAGTYLFVRGERNR